MGHTQMGEVTESIVATLSVEPAISIPAMEIGKMELQFTRLSSAKPVGQTARVGVTRIKKTVKSAAKPFIMLLI